MSRVKRLLISTVVIFGLFGAASVAAVAATQTTATHLVPAAPQPTPGPHPH